jgi:NhaP-type Na+/H+ and K+/H+ antiporter
MSLTKQDLAAIGELFDKHFNVNFDAKFDEKFDEKMEPYMQQIAAGFAEVHGRLSTIEQDLKQTKDTVTRIELQQRSMIVREDDHAIRIERLEKHTGLAPHSLPKSGVPWHNKHNQ